MRRTVVTRVLNLFGALLLASSGPGLVHAHEAAHLFAADHEREHAGGATTVHVVEVGPELEAADCGGQVHAHPVIGSAVASRPVMTLAVPVTGTMVLAAVSVAVAGPAFDTIQGISTGPAPHTPSQPRAPPLD